MRKTSEATHRCDKAGKSFGINTIYNCDKEDYNFTKGFEIK